MAWGDDSGDSFGDGWGGGGGDSYGNDAYGDIGNSFGNSSGGTSSDSGSSTGAYGNDAYGQIGNSLSDSSFGFGGAGSGFGSSTSDMGGFDSSNLGDMSSLYGNTSLANLESYYSSPTQIGYSSPFSTQSPVGYLGSLATQPSTAEQQQVRQMMSNPADTTLMGWNDQLSAQQQMQNLSPVSSWNTNQVQDQLRNAYENNPFTRAAQAAQTLGTYGSMLNPAAGLAGLAGSAADYGLKSYYGQNPSAQGIAGTIGGTLGSSLAGPAGAVLGTSTARALASETPGQTFGTSMGTGVGSTLGSLLGGSIAGPIGARIGSMTLGDLAKVAMAAQSFGNQQRQAKDVGRAQEQQQQYANQLAGLVSNPDSFQNSAMFKSQRAQALKEGLRGLAAQGKLGSGARAYAMGNVASNIANQYYNQEANRLANLAGSAQQQVELARAKANAEGARNYQLMQLASKYLT